MSLKDKIATYQKCEELASDAWFDLQADLKDLLFGGEEFINGLRSSQIYIDRERTTFGPAAVDIHWWTSCYGGDNGSKLVELPIENDE